MIKIEPVGYRLVVKPEEIQKQSKGGIVLAVDERLEKGAISRGQVLGVGPEAFKDIGSGTPWVKEGDWIYFAKYAGKWIKTSDGNEVIVLNDSDVVAKETGSLSTDIHLQAGMKGFYAN